MWHVLFVLLIGERRPPQVEVRSEVVLTSEPQRADILLLQRLDVPRADEQATVLPGLWPLLSRDTLVELKSVMRPPRPRDWSRLLGYGAQYFAGQVKRLERASELTLVMVVPSLTPTLRDDAKALGLEIRRVQPGYRRVEGLPFSTYLVLLGEAAEAEQDDLLGWFGGGTMEREDTRWWVMAHATAKDGTTKLSEREGYREMLQALLATLPPEERLAGMAPEEIVLALPDEILARLPAEFLATLSETVQSCTRERLDARKRGG